MTIFEQYLIDIGYIKYVLNCKLWAFEKPKYHELSTISNLDHRYFHKNDPIIKKIAEKHPIESMDRSKEINFGLHESHKPPTLINPRPRIEIKQLHEGEIVIKTELFDDSMNIVLQKCNPAEIYKAMYDKSIVFKFDFTKQK